MHARFQQCLAAHCVIIHIHTRELQHKHCSGTGLVFSALLKKNTAVTTDRGQSHSAVSYSTECRYTPHYWMDDELLLKVVCVFQPFRAQLSICRCLCDQFFIMHFGEV